MYKNPKSVDKKYEKLYSIPNFIITESLNLILLCENIAHGY